MRTLRFAAFAAALTIGAAAAQAEEVRLDDAALDQVSAGFGTLPDFGLPIGGLPDFGLPIGDLPGGGLPGDIGLPPINGELPDIGGRLGAILALLGSIGLPPANVQ